MILYGPPASGKSTITRELETLDPRFRLFRRLKVGGRATPEYRNITARELNQLRVGGQIIWENTNYGATYATDRGGLAHALDSSYPVVHAGQPGAVEAVTRALDDARWWVVALTCDRATARARLVTRNVEDLHDRLANWDSTAPLPGADLTADTDQLPARTTALLVTELVEP